MTIFLAGESGKKTTEYSKEGVPVPGSTIVESEVKTVRISFV